MKTIIYTVVFSFLIFPLILIQNSSASDIDKMIIDQPGSLSAIKTPSHFPTHLKVLTNATKVELAPVGVAGICGKECSAYLKTIETKKFDQKDFEWILKNGTTSGKLYAALLLGKCDPKTGEQALKSLRSEKAPVSYTPGGSIRPVIAPLGEQAKRLLKNPNY